MSSVKVFTVYFDCGHRTKTIIPYVVGTKFFCSKCVDEVTVIDCK